MIEVRDSETYKKVLEHRRQCSKWGKGFCLHCFGGGLNIFVRDLETEIIKNEISLKRTRANSQDYCRPQ
jgi:hypothetical protein